MPPPAPRSACPRPSRLSRGPGHTASGPRTQQGGTWLRTVPAPAGGRERCGRIYFCETEGDGGRRRASSFPKGPSSGPVGRAVRWPLSPPLPSFPLPEIDSLRISLPDGDFRVIHVPILTPTPKIWSEKRHPGTRESGGFLTAPPSRLSLTRPASRNGDPAQPRATLSAARLPPRTRPR